MGLEGRTGSERTAGVSPGPSAAWVVGCAFWSVAGWVLSGLGALHGRGYGAALGLGLVAAALWARPWAQGWRRPWSRALGGRRFRRVFPAAFVVVAGLAILGGLLYLPTNYDGLAYRTPRVLNWLAEHRWHWIESHFNRLNTRAMGFEWVAAPWIALTGTDRWVFVVNGVSLGLLPGLVFSCFTRLGVARRSAWHWMWVFPTGYCFLLQAGSIGNDLFGAVFGLAALDFALRARVSGRVCQVWLSVLAAALLTGSKASNLPLLLPWGVAIAPSLGLLRQRAGVGLAVLVVAAGASLLPLTVVNLRFSGDWTGLRAEQVDKLGRASVLNFANNVVLLSLQNLAPPVFPLAGWWNEAVPRFMPAGLRARLVEAFEPGGARWLLGELQVEESAGLGFGVSALAVATAAAGLRRRGWARVLPRTYAGLILWCAWAALGAFMLKSGLTTAARLVTPYYGYLLPGLLLVSEGAQVWRQRWWRAGAGVVFGLAGLMVVLSPARPLWPAEAVLQGLGPGHGWVQRAQGVYGVFRQRADAFAAVRGVLPAEARVVGFVGFDDPETSLWRPFGSRRVVQVTKGDGPRDLARKGIGYVVVNPAKLEFYFQRPFAEWVKAMDGEVTSELVLPLRVTLGSSEWRVVRLRGGGQ